MKLLPTLGFIAYGAVVLGARLPAVAGLATHEAAHHYLEGNGTTVVRFHGSLSDPVLRGDAAAHARDVPHILPRASGWLAQAALLYPLIPLARAAVGA